MACELFTLPPWIQDFQGPDFSSPGEQAVSDRPSFESPEVDLDTEELGLGDLLSKVRPGDVEVTMSDSVEHITNVGLADYEITPCFYRFNRTSDLDWEHGLFDIPDLGTSVEVGRQQLPSEWFDESPIATMILETWGVWQISTDDTGRSIRILAYSPSTERQANTMFSAASSDVPVGLNVDGAHRIAQGILD